MVKLLKMLASDLPQYKISIPYIKGIHDFVLVFSLSIITLNKFVYKNTIFLFVILKNIRIYIIFTLLLVSLKKRKYNLLQYKNARYFNQNQK